MAIRMTTPMTTSSRKSLSPYRREMRHQYWVALMAGCLKGDIVFVCIFVCLLLSFVLVSHSVVYYLFFMLCS